MKKFISITISALILLTLASCDSLTPSERLLVGKWYGQIQHDEDKNGTSSVAEFYVTYKEDKTSVEHGTMRITCKIDDGFYEVLTLGLKCKGTWAIVDKQLFENTTYCDIVIKDVEAVGENVTDDAAQLKDFLTSEKKRLYYDLVVPVKKEVMCKDSSKIKTLNDNELITVDKEGEVYKSSRIISE